MHGHMNVKFATSIRIHASPSLSRTVTFGSVLGMVLTLCTSWFHYIFTLFSWLVSTDFCTCSFQCSLSNLTLTSLHMLMSNWPHTLSCLSMYILPLLGMLKECGLFSRQFVDSLHLLSISTCNIFGALYFNCNAWSCAAIIALPVFAFRSTLDSHRTCLRH
jgi:hypothetical protein